MTIISGKCWDFSALTRFVAVGDMTRVSRSRRHGSDGSVLKSSRNDGEYWLKFKHSEVLIRSIYDKKYPENPIDFPGYYKAEVYNWYHNGLEVRAYPYAVDARIRQLKNDADEESTNPEDYDIVNCRLEVFGCIPFDNIIDFDIDGDEYYRYPHLYCDYPSGSNPYEALRYRTESGYIMRNKDGETVQIKLYRERLNWVGYLGITAYVDGFVKRMDKKLSLANACNAGF